MYLKNKDIKKRYSIFPITHGDLWEMYKKAESQTWVAEEIDLSKDNFNELKDNEKEYLKNILAFFAISDGLVIDNIATNFMNEVDVLEAQYFYGHQTFIEQVHCVTEDTLILTKNGNKKIGDYVNTKQNVWNGSEWSTVDIVETGIQDIYEVMLSNGMSIKCTNEHEFWLRIGNHRHPELCKDVKYKLKDIEIGNIISNYELHNPISLECYEKLENPYVNGFFSADGSYANKTPRLVLFADKQKLYHIFEPLITSKKDRKDKFTFYLTNKVKDKFFVPIGSYSLDDKLRWLEGYLDGDGCVNLNRDKEYTSIQFSGININFLKEIQLLLIELGCIISIKEGRDEHEDVILGNLAKCKKQYLGYISGNNVYKLVTLGFNPKRLLIKTKKIISPRPTLIRVEKITKLKEKEMTYCFNEPLKHSAVFNGVLTGQSNGYSLLIDTYIKNNKEKEDLFNSMETNPAVAKKVAWAEKWIQHPSFSHRLIAFACVEGISFSSVFSGVFWFRSRNKMSGLGGMNELILKDETAHYEFALNLYKNYVKDEYKINTLEISRIILECYDTEKTFIEESLPDGLQGLTKEMMIQYVKYVTDIVLNDFGCDREFNVNNPLDYMSRIGLSAKNNFFEKRDGEYTRLEIPTTNEGIFDTDF